MTTSHRSHEEYNENGALKQYVWRNYRELVRPHECFPSAELIRDRLPSELRDEFWAHILECRAIGDKASEFVREMEAKEGGVCDVMPSFPEMSSGLSRLVVAIISEFETRTFQKVLDANRGRIVIHRCSRCNRILIGPHSEQCLWCGYDWHGMTNAEGDSPR
jgi:hypothetical protein